MILNLMSMIFLGSILTFLGLVIDLELQIRMLLIIGGILLIFITILGFDKLKKDKFGE
jgi:hypothetical protein